MNKRTYEAIALSNEFTGGRLFGRISFSGDRLHFTNGDFVKELSIYGMTITRGGASDSLYFFSNSSLPDLSFYTRDGHVINDPVLNANADISDQLKELKKKKNKSLLFYIITSILIAAIAYGSFTAFIKIKDGAVKAAASAVPVEWEEKLGNVAFKQAGIRIIENQSLANDLKKITNPLVHHAETLTNRNYNFQFYISSDKSVNAFALPGGRIVIHAGLIHETKTAEELAGVLAHEISHVIEQHSMRQLIQTLGLFFIMQAVLGDVEGIMAVLLENSGYLLALKFSRDFEREADSTGLLLLDQAGIDPSGMASFFEKLAEKEKRIYNGENQEPNKDNSESETNSIDSVFESLSTHPDTESRIEELNKKIIHIKKNKYSKINLDYIRFKYDIESAAD